MQYKWTVLTNTTMGVVLASADINILIIAIFRDIDVDPMAPGAFGYLLSIIITGFSAGGVQGCGGKDALA